MIAGTRCILALHKVIFWTISQTEGDDDQKIKPLNNNVGNKISKRFAKIRIKWIENQSQCKPGNFFPGII
jgi:hypothetical protein